MALGYVFGFIGGLALFLYGMHMMSGGLEEVASDKLKPLLGKLTSNRFTGVLVGVGITAVIQSSSATTIMAVGFVNAGLLTLSQAAWVIMGANIGTTVTGQLIALNTWVVAPLIAVVGVILCVFFKNEDIRKVGRIIAGLGFLFIGMNTMSDSASPLSDSPRFLQIVSKFENPFLGILAGAGFTAVIQSSSAAVGILEALVNSSAIAPSDAVYILFGQNIGTCITAFIGSLAMSRAAKRATLIHFLFNVSGTVIFTLVAIFTDFEEWVCSWTPDAPAMAIANMHTVFNVGTALILLPLGKRLVNITYKILPDKKRGID